MRKYTTEEKEQALRFFEENFTAREISGFLDIPEGTLYRWRSEESSKDPKSEQIFASSKASPDSSPDPSKIEKLEEDLRSSKEKILELESKLNEIYTWATRQIRSEQKRREQSEGPRFNFGK